jgi:hypothetical protein
MASLGAAVAPVPGGDGFSALAAASLPVPALAQDGDLAAPSAASGRPARRDRPLSRVPSVPFALYALIPIVLAALELRSRA